MFPNTGFQFPGMVPPFMPGMQQGGAPDFKIVEEAISRHVESILPDLVKKHVKKYLKKHEHEECEYKDVHKEEDDTDEDGIDPEYVEKLEKEVAKAQKMSKLWCIVEDMRQKVAEGSTIYEVERKLRSDHPAITTEEVKVITKLAGFDGIHKAAKALEIEVSDVHETLECFAKRL